MKWNALIQQWSLGRLATCLGAWGLVVFCLAELCLGCDAIRPQEDATSETIELEVGVFEGGYGIDWHESVARQYEAEYPERNVKVNLWGDPRINEIVKPRILRGDPPDLLLVSHMPIWVLIAANKLESFNDALEVPAPGSDKPWGDLFMPGTLINYSSEDTVYGVPSAFGAWVVWYDARLFREHGWTPPETWAEFVELCEAARAEELAPIAYQGKYPVYGWYTFMSMIHLSGGMAAINRINEPQRGAFSHPDVVRAAAYLQELSLTQFQRGAHAMSHTESQLQFVNGNAAMIFCGLWLYNEMRHNIPADFEMRCFNIPPIPGGKGNPKLVNGEGSEFLYVSKDAKHPEAAFDFARYMVSPEQAPSMGRDIGVISPLKGATPPEAVPSALESALELVNEAPGIYNIRIYHLLLEWQQQVMVPNMAQLLRGEITPEAFCAALDRGVESAMDDPDVIIPPYTPVDPATYGEPVEGAS